GVNRDAGRLDVLSDRDRSVGRRVIERYEVSIEEHVRRAVVAPVLTCLNVPVAVGSAGPYERRAWHNIGRVEHERVAGNLQWRVGSAAREIDSDVCWAADKAAGG